ncbi:unnamed protein product [Caenorhabditis bovis]|uniref:Helitron helicase-like domain-containing protein n=1 Tax=Caenorhabditis bovis TaxID=2654633 RepID=A0A8S1FDG7_9PELO|nr:unnamed protein product [Caenorhabditis bovis]
MSTVFAKFRGYTPYWNQCRLRILNYLAFFGPPTCCVTLNPNEKNWPDLHALYSKITGKVIGRSSNLLELLEKVEMFITHALLHENGPLGKIERIEDFTG